MIYCAIAVEEDWPKMSENTNGLEGESSRASSSLSGGVPASQESGTSNGKPKGLNESVQQQFTRFADYFVICGLDLDSGLEPDLFAGTWVT